jgi:Toprim-like
VHLKQVRKFVLAVDADEPGQKLETELARRLGHERCWRISWPHGCKDANDVLRMMRKDVLRALSVMTPYRRTEWTSKICGNTSKSVQGFLSIPQVCLHVRQSAKRPGRPCSTPGAGIIPAARCETR